MQCKKCDKFFIRTPKHKRKIGVRVRCVAKLCPTCRQQARSVTGKKSKGKHWKRIGEGKV